MKIAIVNFSGNVGKSTLANHMLVPRIKDAVYIPVESINADDSDVEGIRGKKFGALIDFMRTQDNVVVDVGASNIEDFVKLMKQFHGSHEDFDYFIVPTIKEEKQQKDTVSTIESLSAIGVPASKIRLVFNKIDINDDDVEEEFAALIAYQQAEKKFWLNTAAIIYENEIFKRLKALKMKIPDMVADKTDYRAKFTEAKDPVEKQHFIQMLSAQQLAHSVNQNFESVFKLLFKK